jgi:hypothetical protein
MLADFTDPSPVNVALTFFGERCSCTPLAAT